jgi:cell division septum initiation protein DivIVA
MLDKKSKNTEQTVAEIVENLTNKISELSEKNGELKADNRSLKAQAESQKQTIRELESDVQSLQEMQDNLIQAASKTGINLTPVLEQAGPNGLWISRGLELAGSFLKPRIAKLTLPDFNAAKSVDELQHFLVQLPGFGPKGDERVAQDQYGYTQVNAEQFILRENH